VPADLTRLVIKSGEALLVRFPDDYTSEACERMSSRILQFLRDKGLDWPVIFAPSSIEFAVIGHEND
jgi:hypothetical protein